MITIIICSRNSQIPSKLRDNIASSIGIEYEVVCIDNSQNKYSIFEAYNLGARQSKFPFLCFIHDDILFQTANWGINLIQHFENSEFGLIGVAGSQYKSKYLSGWGCSPKFMRVNITEIHSDGFKNVMYNNPTSNKLEEVICIDGVFMATKKSVMDEFKFDDKTFHYSFIKVIKWVFVMILMSFTLLKHLIVKLGLRQHKFCTINGTQYYHSA